MIKTKYLEVFDETRDPSIMLSYRDYVNLKEDVPEDLIINA